MSDGSNSDKTPSESRYNLSAIKDILNISVIISGFVGSIIAGAVWVQILDNRVVQATKIGETNAALISAHESALKEVYGRLDKLASLKPPGTVPSPTLKEQQCYDLSQQRRSARGKTADAVQAAMNALGCSH